MIYSNFVNSSYRNEFIDKVSSISSELKIKPEWLMQLMKSESGISPAATNYQNGRLVAVGLIQFTKPTAQWLGTTHSDLLSMGGIKQLDYVKKYFLGYKGKIKDYFDLYLITFFPAAIGKPDNYVFKTSTISASTIAKQNPAINQNKDAQITMKEFKEYVLKTVPPQYRDIMFKKKVA